MKIVNTVVFLFIWALHLIGSEGQNSSSGNTENTEPSLTQTAETNIVNVAFEDIAPCPCDLTSQSCDINCCCDAECSDSEKLTFSSCIPFLPGGQTAETQQYLCSSNHHNPEDWFPLTCVVFEYNAFLGYFYDWQFKLSENVQTFLNKLSTASFYWYREEESRTVTDTNPDGYKYGIGVKTGRPQGSTPQDQTLQFGVLSIPQPSLTGSCLNTAPVRYLKNLESECTYEMSADLCDSSSVLSQLYFIQSSVLAGTTVKFFSVLEEEASAVISETNVEYRCADDTYLSSYLKSTQVMSDLNDVSQANIFNYALPTNPNCTDSCGNDICIDLTIPDPVSTPTVAPVCPVQVPSVPSLNVNNVCQNAVIDVDYKLIWVGSKIARLDATVIVADVPLNNSAGTGVNVLSQKYKVTFEHNSTSVDEYSTDNFYNITNMPYERSGKVGYDKGKKIHSGSVVRDNSSTPGQFMYVNANSSREMALFDPSADGLCINAGRRSVKFGDDITSSCKLMLGTLQLTDCSGLRKLIINRLNTLMPSNVLGRRGYNDPNSSGYWLDVLRDDLSESCIASEYFPIGISPIDNRTGICFNITNGIHLDVLYGETGKSNNYPIYEILGSRISYTNTTWQVKCSGLAGSACRNNTTQPFYLTSSVKFTQIPPQTPTPVPKYYETPEEDDVELCPGDRCWDNLFYPLSGRYQSNDREYVFGMVSITIIFFIGYLLITRPWW